MIRKRTHKKQQHKHTHKRTTNQTPTRQTPENPHKENKEGRGEWARRQPGCACKWSAMRIHFPIPATHRASYVAVIAVSLPGLLLGCDRGSYTEETAEIRHLHTIYLTISAWTRACLLAGECASMSGHSFVQTSLFTPEPRDMNHIEKTEA